VGFSLSPVVLKVCIKCLWSFPEWREKWITKALQNGDRNLFSTDYISIMDNLYVCLTVVCGCLSEFRKKESYNVRFVLIVSRSERRSCRMMKPECMPLIITVEERHNSGRMFKSLISAIFFVRLASNLFLLNGLRAQSRLSPLVGLLPLAFEQVRFWMEFPPFLMKQLY